MSRLVIIVFFILALAVLSDCQKCSGFHWRRYRNKCFFFSRGYASWYEAQTMCRLLKGRLAEFNTPGEERFLLGMLKVYFNKGNYWVGGTDIQHEGHWKWITSLKSIPASIKWYPGQPNNYKHNQHCLRYTEGIYKTWTDDPCEGRHHYICERR